MLPQKTSPLTSMAPKKQTIAHNGAMSKGRTNTTVGDTIPLHTIDRELVGEHTGSSSSQRAAANACVSLLYEGQIIQMFVDMKEQMKDQQARSDRDQE